MKIREKLKKIYWFIDEKYPTLSYVMLRVIFSNGKQICPNEFIIYDNSIKYFSFGRYPTITKSKLQYFAYTRYKKKYMNNILLEKDSDDNYYENIVTIAIDGLYYYNQYLKNKSIRYKKRMIQIADWLCEKQGNNGEWFYPIAYIHTPTGEHFEKNWLSAMAQGMGISLLIRVYYDSKNDKYLNAAINATKPLKISIEDGGVCRIYNGCTFWEEYPTLAPSLTLNGFLYCLLGLIDLKSFYFNSDIECMVEKGFLSLLELLPLYDDAGCSSYDLTYLVSNTRIRSKKYHLIHIQLLQILNSLYKNDEIMLYITKWKMQLGIKK